MGVRRGTTGVACWSGRSSSVATAAPLPSPSLVPLLLQQLPHSLLVLLVLLLSLLPLLR